MSVLSFGKNLLAVRHDTSLLCNIRKPANDLFVAVVKAIDGIRDTNLLAVVNNVLLSLSEIMSRNAWIEVVHGLKSAVSLELQQSES